MDKLLHERLRESRKGQSWIGVRPYDDEFILWRSDAERLADEIERYYIPRPRFEDGEPAQLWDHVDVEGNEEVIENFDYPTTEHCIVRTDCNNCIVTFVDGKNPLKSPTPNVLDADGVEIKVGQKRWSVESDNEYDILEIKPDGSLVKCGCPNNDELYVWLSPSQLTNEKPVFESVGKAVSKGNGRRMDRPSHRPHREGCMMSMPEKIVAIDDIGEGYKRLIAREEITRCRDCKRMDEIQIETNQPCSTDPNGFCAWAERKDG